MNIDFHYNATYLAALIAGFSDTEAGTIAYAAQFVDELAKPAETRGRQYITTPFGDTLPDSGVRPSDAPKITTTMTTEQMWEMSVALSWSTPDYIKFKEIWQIFHFLPGNEFYSYRYEGPKTNKGWFNNWKFSESDNELFRQMCLPNSIAVYDLAQKLKDYKNKVNYLHMVGICMHIIADTWSHQKFIGQPRWFANGINSAQVEKTKDAGDWTDVNWNTNPGSADNIQTKSFSRASGSLSASYESIGFLGHGDCGHLPDYSCLKYRYKAQWDNAATWTVRNNREIFLMAFNQMVNILTAVRTNAAINSTVIEGTSKDYGNGVSSAINYVSKNNADKWNEVIKDKNFAALAEFKAETWLNEFKTNYKKGIESNYIFFTNAAEDVVNLVKNSLHTTRFVHTNKANSNDVRHSSLVNIESNGQYGVVCSGGRLFTRAAENFKIKGTLTPTDKVRYTDFSNTVKSFSIDERTKEFIITNGSNTTRSYELEYKTWGGANFTAKIIDRTYPL